MYRTMRKPKDPAAAYELTKKKYDKAIKRHDILVGHHSEYCMSDPRKARKAHEEIMSIYPMLSEYIDDMVYLNEKYGVGDGEWCNLHKREEPA